MALTVIVVCGTPLAWWLGRTRSRRARWLETALQLPAVIPPAVAGIALLLTFGRRGVLGAWLDRAGLGVAFSGAAVVMAQVFVAAPFYLSTATAAFGRLDGNQLAAARSLGASPARVFFLVGLPLAIYAALESDLRTAQALAVILVAVAFGLLLVIRRWQKPKDVSPM